MRRFMFPRTSAKQLAKDEIQALGGLGWIDLGSGSSEDGGDGDGLLKVGGGWERG